jgi:hypothetical protein
MHSVFWLGVFHFLGTYVISGITVIYALVAMTRLLPRFRRNRDVRSYNGQGKLRRRGGSHRHGDGHSGDHGERDGDSGGGDGEHVVSGKRDRERLPV